MKINSIKKTKVYDIKIGPLCDKCVDKVQFQVLSPLELYTITGRFMYGLMVVRATSSEEALKVARITDEGINTEGIKVTRIPTSGPTEVIESWLE